MGPVSTKSLRQQLKVVPRLCKAFDHFTKIVWQDYAVMLPPDDFDYAAFSNDLVEKYYLANPDLLRSYQSIILGRLLDDAMVLAEYGYDYTKLANYLKNFLAAADLSQLIITPQSNLLNLTDHAVTMTVLQLDQHFRAERRNQPEILFLLEFLFLLNKDDLPPGYLVAPLANDWTHQSDNAKLQRELNRAYALSLVPSFYQGQVDFMDPFFKFAQSHRLTLETKYILFYYRNHDDDQFLRNITLSKAQKKELLDQLPDLRRKVAEVVIAVCAK